MLCWTWPLLLGLRWPNVKQLIYKFDNKQGISHGRYHACALSNSASWETAMVGIETCHRYFDSISSWCTYRVFFNCPPRWTDCVIWILNPSLMQVRAGSLSGDLCFPSVYCPGFYSCYPFLTVIPVSLEFHFPEFTSAVADMKNSVADRNNGQPR